MQVLILSGGEGQRLRPLTRKVPKILLTIGRQTILEHLIEWLAAYRPESVHLCLGRAAEKVGEFIQSRPWPMPITYQIEEQPMGTGGALRLASHRGYWSQRAWVINGDLITDMELSPFIDLKQSGIALLWREEAVKDYGCVELSVESGKIKRFTEKEFQASGSWINAGVYLLSPDDLQEFTLGDVLSLENEVFPRLAAKGELLGVPVNASQWIDTGVPTRFLEAQHWIVSQGMGMKNIKGIKPGIYCESQVLLGKDCQLLPPVLIRENSWIGEGVSLGPNVVIGEGCRIGTNSILQSVYLGDHSQIGSYCKLHDVLTDREVKLGERVMLQRYILGYGTRMSSENRFF